MQGICLNQHALEIQLAKQLFEHGPLVVLAGGVAGLADCHPQGGRLQRHLGDECRTATSGGLNRAPQGLAITDQLIEIGCSTWDLGNGPITDGTTESRHVHLLKERAKGGVRGWTPEFQAQRLGQHAVVGDGKTFQVSQALAAAQDSQHRHQAAGTRPEAAPHAACGRQGSS
jgi:hypothetical protein